MLVSGQQLCLVSYNSYRLRLSPLKGCTALGNSLSQLATAVLRSRRHHAPQGPDVLKRLELRIKHGVAKPSPLYEALRRNPPPTPLSLGSSCEIRFGPLERIPESQTVAPRSYRAARGGPQLAHALRAIEVGVTKLRIKAPAGPRRHSRLECARTRRRHVHGQAGGHAWLMRGVLDWDWEVPVGA